MYGRTMRIRITRTRRHAALLAAICLTLCMLSGCSGDEASREEPPQEISPQETGAAAEPDGSSLRLPYYPSAALNPFQCDNSCNQIVGKLIYEGLFSVNPSFEAEACLCESWQTEDNTEWTFKLRDGVYFSGGKKLSAEDVVYSYEMADTSDSGFYSRMSNILSVTELDERTVRIYLRKANVRLPLLLDIPIVESWQGDEPRPNGTGPYCLAEEPDGVCLTLNSGWWKGTENMPERIDLVSTSSPDQEMFDFQTGVTNFVVYDRTRTGAVNFRETGESYVIGTSVMQYVGYNTDGGFTSDPEVRAALSLAVDRQFISETVFAGFAAPAYLPLSPYSSEYAAIGAEETPHGGASAREALKKLGFTEMDPDGVLKKYGMRLTLDFIVNEENAYKVSAAQTIAESLREAGADVTVRLLDWETFQDELSYRDFDLYYGEIKMQNDFDLSEMLGIYGDTNYGNYSNYDADELIDRYMAGTADAADFYGFLTAASPICPVLFKNEMILTQRGLLSGATPSGSDPFYGIGNWSIGVGRTEE